MSELMMSKYIESCVEEKYTCFHKCKGFFDLCKYVKVYMQGFDMKKYLFLLYFFNNIDSKYENFLIYDDNKVIGCFSLFLDKDGSCLYDYCVINDYRGKGLGIYYLNGILKLVYSKGYDILYLFVKEDNLIALSLYKSCGFIFEEWT